MKSLLHFYLATLAIIIIASCGQTNNPSAPDSVSDTVLMRTPDAMDTTFRYENYHILMDIRKGDSLVSSTIYWEAFDTLFHPDGRVVSVKENPFNSSYEDYTEHYMNGKVKSEWRFFDADGSGGTSAETRYYDTAGTLDYIMSNEDYFPPDAEGHLDLCGVVTYKYFQDGNLQLIKQYDERYAAGYSCPCGTWLYFDADGHLIKKDPYRKCGAGNVDCEDTPR
jgi:hypothetical protein